MADQVSIIVIGVDDSGESEGALVRAPTLFSNKAEFHIACIRPFKSELTMKDAVMEHFRKDDEETKEKGRQEASTKLQDKFRALADTTGLTCKIVEVAGDGEALVKYCNKVEASALFIPVSIGESSQGLFLGNFAKYCVDHASFPVMVDRMTPKISAVARSLGAMKGAASGAASAASGVGSGYVPMKATQFVTSTVGAVTGAVSSVFSGEKKDAEK